MVLNRVYSWLFYQLTCLNTLRLSLLLAVMIGLVVGLTEAMPQLDGSFIMGITVEAILISWLITRTHLSTYVTIPIILLIGFISVIGYVGQLFEPLGKFIIALVRFVGLGFYQFYAVWPDSTAVWAELTTLLSRLMVILQHCFSWLSAWQNGSPTFDPVANLILWGIAVWLVSCWGSWWIQRHNHPLLAMAPAGTLLVVIFAYTKVNLFSLQLLLGSTLILLTINTYLKQRLVWEQDKLDFSSDIPLNIAFTSLPIVFFVLGVATIIPNLSIHQVATYTQSLIWQNSFNKQLETSLGLKSRHTEKQATLLDTVHWGGLPRQHLLGTGPELSEQVVMQIEVKAISEDDHSFSIPHPYWRSLTYDHYTGLGWRTPHSNHVSYQANEETFMPQLPYHQPLQQVVRMITPKAGLLHVAGHLLYVNQPYQVAWRDEGDIFGASIQAKHYQATSFIPIINESRLRATNADYPKAIRDQYLKLPNTVPNRVRELAHKLTDSASTPYDKAIAIEQYLRQIPYTLDVPALPTNIDVADYFLFDLRQGYCDYYATSMVVLARSVGLPARFVMGYTTGNYDEDNQTFIVTEADAHSWVEIYFPEHGWVEFEPTGARLTQHNMTEVDNPRTPPLFREQTTSMMIPWGSIGWYIASSLIGLVGLVVAIFLVDYWYLTRLSAEHCITVIYQRLYRHGTRLQLILPIGTTPYEFANIIITQLSVDLPQFWQPYLQPYLTTINQLSQLYVQVSYNNYSPTDTEQTNILHTWQRLQGWLWLIWLYRRVVT